MSQLTSQQSMADAVDEQGTSNSKGSSSLLKRVGFTEDVDPLFNLPYVAIPDAARESFGSEIVTIKNAALFYFGLHKVLVGRIKKELFVMVNSGGILMAKKAKGVIARHIPFEKICEVVTNVDRENANKLEGQTTYAPFLLLSLVATEPSDLVLLSEESTELAILFSILVRIWSANRAYPHVRIKTVEAPSLSAAKIDHRVPKSSRNEKPNKPTLQLLLSKQQQRMAFVEVSKRDAPVIQSFVVDKAKEVAERKQLIETSKKLHEAKLREEKAVMRLMEEEEKDLKREQSQAAVFASVTKPERRKSVSMNPSSRSISPTDSPPSLSPSPSTTVSPSPVKRRPRSHTLGINEVLKPFLKGNTGENDIISYMSGGLFSPDASKRFELPVKLGPTRLSYSVAFTGNESKDPKTGIPYASVARKAVKKFPILSKMTDAALLFFDTVFVNSDSNTLIESFIYFCPQRLYVADSEDKVRVLVEINDISNLINVENIRGMAGAEKVSEAVVMMLREGMADVLIGFKFPGRREAFLEYLKRACASSNEPTWIHMDTCKTLPETGGDLSGYDDFAPDVPPPSKKEKGNTLSPAQIAQETFPEGEFAVTPQMKIDGPQLAKGWVQWAGYVWHYTDPYPSKKKDRNPDMRFKSLMYISSTHVYLLRNKVLVRCMDTKYLRRIDVQTLLNKRTVDARAQRYILVCDRESEEFDLCVEHEWEEDAQRCMSAILQAARKTLGSDDSLLKLEPFNDVGKNVYRFLPPRHPYLPVAKDLPMSTDFIRQMGQLRNKIARYFVRNDTRRITESLELAKEHHENADEFFTKLIQQYGVPPEKNVNILDYRGRLGRFFGKYAPEVIPRIPYMLEKAKGAEEEMIYRLVLKYGPEPEIPSDDGDDDDNMTRALKRIFQKFDPPRVQEAKLIREKNYGTERELMDLLRVQYGAPIDDPMFAVPDLLSQEHLLGRPRLRRFCLRYMPERTDAGSINALLLAHRGSIDDLMRNLVEKHGPEPPDVTRRSRDRLRRFLNKYEPSHPTDDAAIDDYYAAFNGAEQELFAKLVKRYGLEPLPEGAEELKELNDVVDLSKELPYATIPDAVADRFPSMIEKSLAVYWFGLVSHWEPPHPATLRYGYVSSTHFYVAEGEGSVQRCIPLPAIRAIYINTKRDLEDERQCSVMFQVAATTTHEHDLFLTFASDAEAKAMLWVVVEIIAKQNWNGPGTRVLAVKHFDDVESNLTPHSSFNSHFEPAPLPPQRLHDHPQHNMRSLLAAEKLGHATPANRLWHTVSKGPNLVNAESLLLDNAKGPLDYLSLQKVTFGAGHPNYKAMRPSHSDGAAAGGGAVWAPAEAIRLFTAKEGEDDDDDDDDAENPQTAKSNLKTTSANAAALYEQARAVTKYSRDGRYGTAGSLPLIERDKSVNAEFIRPARRADLAVLDDGDEEAKDSSSDDDSEGRGNNRNGMPDFETAEEDGDFDFDSDAENAEDGTEGRQATADGRGRLAAAAAEDEDTWKNSPNPLRPPLSTAPQKLLNDTNAMIFSDFDRAQMVYLQRQQQFQSANSATAEAALTYARRNLETPMGVVADVPYSAVGAQRVFDASRMVDGVDVLDLL